MAQIIGLGDHTLGWSPALPLLNCVALDKPCSHPSFTDKAGSGDVNTGLSRLGKDQLSALTLGCVCGEGRFVVMGPVRFPSSLTPIFLPPKPCSQDT